MDLLILLLSFCLTLEYIELSQFGSIPIYRGFKTIYLRLDGFKSGDNVYIEVSYFSNLATLDAYSISYRQSLVYFGINRFFVFEKSHQNI